MLDQLAIWLRKKRNPFNVYTLSVNGTVSDFKRKTIRNNVELHIGRDLPRPFSVWWLSDAEMMNTWWRSTISGRGFTNSTTRNRCQRQRKLRWHLLIYHCVPTPILICNANSRPLHPDINTKVTIMSTTETDDDPPTPLSDKRQQSLSPSPAPSQISNNSLPDAPTGVASSASSPASKEGPIRLPTRPPNYKLKCNLSGHKRGVSSVKFSPDGKWIASACMQETFNRDQEFHSS